MSSIKDHLSRIASSAEEAGENMDKVCPSLNTRVEDILHEVFMLMEDMAIDPKGAGQGPMTSGIARTAVRRAVGTRTMEAHKLFNLQHPRVLGHLEGLIKG